VPLILAVLIATAAGAVLGVLQERLTLAPVRKSPAFIQITITLGVAVIVRGIALIQFGKDPLAMPAFSGDGTFELLSAILPIQTLWVWGTTAAMLVGIYYVLQHTDIGRAVRACSINVVAARLMGVNAERLTLMVYAIAGGTGALAGAVITPVVLASWDAGFVYALKGFIGAILGGLRSPVVAVLGGLGVGVAACCRPDGSTITTISWRGPKLPSVSRTSSDRTVGPSGNFATSDTWKQYCRLVPGARKLKSP